MFVTPHLFASPLPKVKLNSICVVVRYVDFHTRGKKKTYFRLKTDHNTSQAFLPPFIEITISSPPCIVLVAISLTVNNYLVQKKDKKK